MRLRYFGSWMLILLMLVGMTGCASQPRRDFDTGKKMLTEGKFEQGIAQIEQASKAEPENIEYKQYLYTQREAVTIQLLERADADRKIDELDKAQSGYTRVLAIDAVNQRAKVGIDQIKADKRRKHQYAEALALFNKGDRDGATTKLRKILAEDPQLQDAKDLRERIDEKNAEDKAMEPSPKLKSALGKTIFLEFQDAGIKSVFDVISRVSGLSFIFDKDIKSDFKVTIYVKNSTIEDAVKLILTTNQLGQEVLNDNTVMIYPNTAAKIREYQKQVVRSFYLANADVKKTLEMVKTILKAKDVFIDEKMNLLVMRDTPEVIRLAEKLIATADFPEPEVELEVEILEINSNNQTNLGLQFPQKLSASLGNAGTFTQTQFQNSTSDFVTLKITDPAFVLNLLKLDTNTTLLANPRIRVKDRVKAKIHIGQRLPVLTTVSTAGVGSAESVSYIDVGLKLDVEPSIRLEDEVDMKVTLEVSSVNQTITLPSGSQVYQLGTRNADTALRLKDGETQVLAGLIQNNASSSVNKLPGLGDIPLFGRLFSNDSNSKTRTELVLLITPHIVRNVTRPAEIYSEFPSGTDNAIGEPLKTAMSPINTPANVVLPVPLKSADIPTPLNPIQVVPVTATVEPVITKPDSPVPVARGNVVGSGTATVEVIPVAKTEATAGSDIKP